MSELNRHVKEIDKYHKYQKDAYIEYDNVDIPSQFL